MALDIPTDVLTTLKTVFANDPDDHARVLHFLSNQCRDGKAAPYIQSLQSVILVPNVFKLLAVRYAQDTRHSRDSDDAYQQRMQSVWKKFLSENTSDYPDDGKKLKWALSIESLLAVVPFDFKEIVKALPAETVALLMSFVNRQAILKETIDVIVNVDPLLCNIALVGVALTASVIRNVRRWWIGEISGKRCLKNIIDSGLSSAATITIGTGFVVIGGQIGSWFGPVGSAVGAVLVTAISMVSVNTLSDRLMQVIFGLPQKESLENAYRNLRVSATASNSAINSSFQDLESEYIRHGNENKWIELQFAMLVIKEARRQT